MKGLMLHCGAEQVERATLAMVPTPEATDTWHPIPHMALFDQVSRALTAANYRITGEGHGLARDGGNYFGLLEIANGKDADDYATVLGLRNSHTKAFSAEMALGASVFVCDNLSFSGQIVIKRKHTLNIMRDLAQLIDSAVGRLNGMRMDMTTRINRYKDTELDRDYADHLIIELLRARVIRATKIPQIMAEWEAPSHEEFAANGWSAWRLFNAVTESLKGRMPNPRETTALHGVMDGAVGGITLEGDYSVIA